jgi:hypothetical protein
MGKLEGLLWNKGKNEVILEDWNPIGNFPMNPFGTKDLSSNESFEIPMEWLIM